MEIHTTTDGSAAMLSLKGELDFSSAEQLIAALAAFPEATDLVLDLQELSFLDVFGLRAILSADRRFKKKGSFSILNVPEKAMEVLRRTGLKERLCILS